MKTLLKTILLSLSFLFFTACASKQPIATPQAQNLRTPMILIQGVHLDGSSWDAFKKLIPNDQFEVSDLGRIGRDDKQPASLKQIATLSCNQLVRPSVVIAHSYGGAITNAMIGICPEKIKQVIYVAALVPMVGEKPFDQGNKHDQKEFAKAVTFEEQFVTPRDAKTFFHVTDASIDQSVTPLPTLHREWTSIWSEPLAFDKAKFMAIPKAYVYTQRDKVVGIETQKKYYRRAGITQTRGIKTGHFPMISNPEMLAKIVLKWAEK